jgi:hypothetical protein
MHVMPLAGWLLRVRPYAGGRFVIGCDWLPWVRLEGRPLNNPPRIASAGLSSRCVYSFEAKLCVVTNRRVRPTQLKYKTSLAVLIPTGLVYQITTTFN